MTDLLILDVAENAGETLTPQIFLVPDSDLQAIIQTLDWIEQNANPLVISENGMVFSNSPNASTIMQNFGWAPASGQQKNQLYPDWNSGDFDLAIIVPGNSNRLQPVKDILNIMIHKVVVREYKLA